MKDLIPIFNQVIGEKEVNAVDARELWAGLESGQKFTDWIKAKVLNNDFFTKGEDWVPLDKTTKGQQSTSQPASANKKDYILSLDTAKRVAMAERTAVGEKVRTHFLACEKEAMRARGPHKNTLSYGADMAKLLRSGNSIAGSLGLKGWKKAIVAHEWALQASEGITLSPAEACTAGLHIDNKHRGQFRRMHNVPIIPYKDYQTGLNCYYASEFPAGFVTAGELESCTGEGYDSDQVLLIAKMQREAPSNVGLKYVPTTEGLPFCIMIHTFNEATQHHEPVELRWHISLPEHLFVTFLEPFVAQRKADREKAEAEVQNPQEEPINGADQDSGVNEEDELFFDL